MRFIPRAIQPAVLEAVRSFPAVVVTGPRRTGKTTLLRRLFPRATYVLLEDPDIQTRARSDPRALLEGLRLPAVFDEIQNVPDLLAYVRTRIDENPRQMGRWLFTGSQEAPLMQGVSESMAGGGGAAPPSCRCCRSVWPRRIESACFMAATRKWWRAPRGADCGSVLTSKRIWSGTSVPSRIFAIWPPFGASWHWWPAGMGRS